MNALAGPLHLLAVVLLVSGSQKLIRPAPAATAMADAGLRIGRGTAAGVVLGAAEISIGVFVLAVPRWWAPAILGLAYAALAMFVIRLRSSGSTAGCGCFGSSTTPPGRAHVVLNVLGAAVGLTTAVLGTPDLVDVLDDGAFVAATYVVLLGVGAGLLLTAPVELARITEEGSSRKPRPFAPVRETRR